MISIQLITQIRVISCLSWFTSSCIQFVSMKIELKNAMINSVITARATIRLASENKLILLANVKPIELCFHTHQLFLSPYYNFREQITFTSFTCILINQCVVLYVIGYFLYHITHAFGIWYLTLILHDEIIKRPSHLAEMISGTFQWKPFLVSGYHVIKKLHKYKILQFCFGFGSIN